MNMQEVRAKFPQYSDMGDVELATALHRKYYSDVPVADFYRSVGLIEDANPTEGMSGLDKLRAGVGKAFVDTGRGVAQLFTSDASETGQRVQRGIDEAKARDAALMDTGAGMAGNIAGNIGLGALTAAIPGANTVIGSAAIGAATGGLMPTATNDSTLSNIVTGGAFGAGGQVAGRMLPGVASALAAPFHQKGRDKLVADTIKRFATNPNAIDNVATPSVPGVQYTLAEATQDPGLAVLQNSARSLDPQISGPLMRRNTENVLATRDAIRGIAGDDAQMAAAEAARNAFARTAYDAPKQAMVQSDDTLRTLMDRPSMGKAWERAKRIAAERGETLVEGQDIPAQAVETGLVNEFGRAITKDMPEQAAQYSGKGLHYLKMGMDALLKDPTSGIAGAEAAAIGETRDQLVGWLGQSLPGYDAARTGYAAASRPINQMQIGQSLYDKYTPALADFGSDLARKRAESFAAALRQGDEFAKQATKFDGATMAGTLEPQQMQALQGIGDYLGRSAFVDDAVRGPGSPTAQNLAGQNIMRQMVGPLGLPESWGESMMARSIAGPLSLAVKPAENAMQESLVQALLDPQRAQQLLQQVAPSERQRLVEALYQYALPSVSVGSGAYAAGQ